MYKMKHTTINNAKLDRVLSDCNEIHSQNTRVLDICRTPLCSDEYRMEKEWRELLPRIVEAVTASEHDVGIWADGPLESGMLLNVYPYIDCVERGGNVFHIEGITATDSSTEHRSWLSFIYCESSFVEMMKDEDLNLEYTRLYMLFAPLPLVVEALNKRIFTISLKWLLEHKAILMSFKRHFVGGYLVGHSNVIAEAEHRLDARRVCGPESSEPSP